MALGSQGRAGLPPSSTAQQAHDSGLLVLYLARPSREKACREKKVNGDLY